ncbi:putative ATP-dependent RNA helicase YTHDC2 [Morus notabilis]|uniref:Putative ATP-dependent RNA helicase YTHDC2 n=1 Tax=Morus notabilis TaxID=981085 RepID=W9QSU0_9ROSA|nr:putative ATP-dependent RNA helicase YTHDC2 [Morus notabilis]
MAGKNRKGGKASVSEGAGIHIRRALDRFQASNAKVYTFEAGMSNQERAFVHDLCRRRGMKSKSSGRGNQRCVAVFKNKKKAEDNKELEGVTSLSFSKEAELVLQDLFTRFPPEEGEEGQATVGGISGKIPNVHRWRDDMFCRPLMSKEQIAKKVESLASKIKNDAQLRQVTAGRSKLPIAAFRDVITSTVESNQVVLLSGETGCGKTTQVPQFLLDYMWAKGKACKIVCTQPRRLSAMSVAERVSYERGEEVGENIGYKVRLESKGGRSSSIVFCTNGLLLRVLVSKGVHLGSNKRLQQRGVPQMTHIIVDEIHERDRFSDLMLAIIRDMLPSFPYIRLIMMSATLDAERFSQYFGGCPIIRVPGFTYPVRTFYLEDVLSILKLKGNNHLDSSISHFALEESELSVEDKLVLDEAINLAWSNDVFDPLLELVSSEGTRKVYNYQHSLSGLTPLMVFAGKGRIGEVCTLLSFGADCQLQTKEGLTALELAEREDQKETVDILKRHAELTLSNSVAEEQLLEKYLAEMNQDIVDVVLIEQLLMKICTDSTDGAVLIFLPGWDEINKIRDRLLMNPLFKDTLKFNVLALHSMIPSIEQKKVFDRPPSGCRKIVLSTNIAETAVTIDDVVYVIDSGRMKEKNYDPYNNVSTLQSSWVSKASARQREGRAGRCQPGICYHLFSKLRAASLPDFQVPEIRRMPVEEICLQVLLSPYVLPYPLNLLATSP